MSIDVSELMIDGDFAEAFTIQRLFVKQVDGETVTTAVKISASGARQPASPADIKMLPEGDRMDEVVIFWSKTEILATLGAPDILIAASGATYRVIKVEARTGYWKVWAEAFTP